MCYANFVIIAGHVADIENVTRLIKYIFIIILGFSFKTKGRVLSDEN